MPASRIWFRIVRKKFQRFIAYALAFRYIILIIFVALLIGALLFAGHFMHFVLFPGNTAENFFITVELPTGSSLDATSDKVKEIEDLMYSTLPTIDICESNSSFGSLGGSTGWFTPGESENWAFIIVTLTPFGLLLQG